MIEVPAPYSLVYREVTGSTNDDALALARDGAPDFTLVWARRQTKARGRHARPWISDPGNLYWSLLLRVQGLGVPVEGLAFVAGLAVADTVAGCVNPARRVALKWPNDVLVDDAKTSGILIERDDEWAVVGIGINHEIAPDPAAVLYRTTCLREAGAAGLTVEALCRRLCLAFHRWYLVWRAEGFGPTMREAYMARMWRLGERIDVSFDREKRTVRSGINRGIDPRGHLLLDVAGSGVEAISSADVLFPRQPPAAGISSSASTASRSPT